MNLINQKISKMRTVTLFGSALVASMIEAKSLPLHLQQGTTEFQDLPPLIAPAPTATKKPDVIDFDPSMPGGEV